MFGLFGFMILLFIRVTKYILYRYRMKPYLMYHQAGLHGTSSTALSCIKSGLMQEGLFPFGRFAFGWFLVGELVSHREVGAQYQ